MARAVPGLALAAAVVALDRATKAWIQARVDLYETHRVIPGLFNIVHSENRGMAFGLGNDGATWLTRLVLVAISLLVLGVLAYGVWQGRRGHAGEQWALFLVASGAIGNLYDRVVYGSVTDFLDVYLGEYHWPTFNVADMAITVGGLLIAWHTLRAEQKSKPVTV